MIQMALVSPSCFLARRLLLFLLASLMLIMVSARPLTHINMLQSSVPPEACVETGPKQAFHFDMKQLPLSSLVSRLLAKVVLFSSTSKEPRLDMAISDGSSQMLQLQGGEGEADHRERSLLKLRKLWVTVTGQSYPEREKNTMSSNNKLNCSQKQEDCAVNTTTVDKNHMQAEKRLVPGGPDPLHHSSHPLSP